MLEKYKSLLNWLITLFLAFTLSSYAYAKEEQTIKIGLLDTPYNEMPLNLSLLPEYEKAYMAGVETAAHVARKYNFDITYKPFFYANGSLDILGQVPKIQTWKADFVIGPSSSDQFLLLRNYLTDMMVLSSYSSDKLLQTLPSNFYSIFLPDTRIMGLLGAYIKKTYPRKNIFIIEQADCKQCVDVGVLFAENYQKISPTTKIVETKIIMDNMKSINSKALVAGHEGDAILAFNTTYYGYISLIKHLSESFPGKKLLFFSDQDNWGGEVGHGSSQENDLNYDSYRIGPLLFDTTYPEYKDFEATYYRLYRSKPTDGVSFSTYITVMSVVQALNKFPEPGSSMREKIVRSYTAALKKNPNWFRPTVYGIYRLTSQGEVLAAKIPVSNSNH